jgi:FkbM family methyltransferase
VSGIGGRRGLRAASISAGFSIARRTRRLGLLPITSRARRIFARATGDHFSIEVGGARIGGSLTDHGEYLSLVSRGAVHPFQLELFVEATQPGLVVADCGAYVGLYSVLAGRRVGAEGKVLAIEPDPRNAQALRANLAANDLSDRVEVIEAAASSRAGTDRLSPSFGQFGSSALGSLAPPAAPDLQATEIETVRLDDVLGGRRIDLVKVDVEGAEALVLEGMRETLARSSGAVVFVECHPFLLERNGVGVIDWLDTLQGWGSLELIDEQRRRLVPATTDLVSALTEDRPEATFNLLWRID